MPPELAYVEANGIRFAYVEQGDGPLVLCLHGFPDTPHGWDDLRPRLVARGFRVVTPFLRGYRPTAIPKWDTTIETLARDVLALIVALGAKNAILVGHDWGAVSAYGAATLAPFRVTKLVTVAIPHTVTFRPTPRKIWGVRHFFEYKLPGAGDRFRADDFAQLRALYARWSPTWEIDERELAPVRECFAERASLEAALGYYRALPLTAPHFLRKPIAVPTVAFAGLDDTLARLVDYEDARPMFTADYVVRPMRGGHFLHREHPDEFARILLEHLAP